MSFMPTVSQYFKCSDINSFASDNGYVINKDKCDTNLNILKITDNAKTDIKYLKGLIYDASTGRICAPGVPIPLDTNSFTKEELIDMCTNDETTVYPAIDGVMLRFYKSSSGESMISTSGSIYPKSWGPSYSFSFVDMFEDVSDQVDMSKLNPNYCYYAIMEHMDHYSFVKNTRNRLTLVHVVDHNIEPVSLEKDTAFTYKHEPILKNSVCISDMLVETDPKPVNPKDFGIVMHLKSGDTVKVYNYNCRQAMKLMPNNPSPYHQWVHLLNKGELAILPKDTEKLLDHVFSNIETYLKYFPWSKDEFNTMFDCFSDMVRAIYDYYHNYIAGSTFELGRYTNFIFEMAKEFNHKRINTVQLIYYLIGEDNKRICYMLNVESYEHPQGPVATLETQCAIAV